MGIKAKLTLIAGLMIVSVASSAVADKLCLQTTVNKKTFKVTNKRVLAATCPKGYTELADTSSFQGAAGATGAQGAAGATGAEGPAGSINLANCRKVENSCTHTAFGLCSAFCFAGYEFVLQYNGSITDNNGCSASTYKYDYLSKYTNGLAYSVSNFTSGNSSCTYEASVYAICCPVL